MKFIKVILFLTLLVAPLSQLRGDGCQQNWELDAVLDWGGVADWDLHLYTPTDHIWYMHVNNGVFVLTRDAYPNCTPVPGPPEHIFGENGECGQYTVRSELRSGCGSAPATTLVATVTVTHPIKINDVPYNENDIFIVHDNVPFVLSAIPTPTPGTNLTSSDAMCAGDDCDGLSGMARYSVHSMLVSLNIKDRPLRYVPPRGPAIDFIVSYNQKESQQPSTFNYSNLGPKWTFNWLST